MRFPLDTTRISRAQPRPDLAGASGIVAVRPVAPRTAPPQVRQRRAPTAYPPSQQADTRYRSQRRIKSDQRGRALKTTLDTRARQRRRYNRRSTDYAPLPVDERV